jgi:hypothetical protein
VWRRVQISLQLEAREFCRYRTTSSGLWSVVAAPGAHRVLLLAVVSGEATIDSGEARGLG